MTIAKRRSPGVIHSLVLGALLLSLASFAPRAAADIGVGTPPPAQPVGMDAGRLLTMDLPTGAELAVPVAMDFAQPAAVQLSEGFEDAWPGPGWQVADGSTGDGGEYLFGQRYCHPHTGSGAAAAVGGGRGGSSLTCTGSYPNNAHSQAVYGPIDLSSATRASLSFHLWGRTQPAQGSSCTDYLFAGSFTSQTDARGTRYCGDATNGAARNGYHEFTIDLAHRLGASQVWIAFVFVSDGSVTDIGFTIDDVTLDIGGTEPAVQGRSYLPLVSAPNLSAPPSFGSAFERLQWTLNAPAAQGIFVLDTTQMNFTQTSGQKCAGASDETPTCVSMSPDEVKSGVRGWFQQMDFRVRRNWVGAYGTGGSGAYGDQLTETTVTYPSPGQIRIAWDRASNTSRSVFTGDVAGDVITGQYFYFLATLVNGLYTSVQRAAQFSSPIIWVPASEWTPLPVTEVRGEDQPSRCLRVWWTPAPDHIPAAPVQEYIVQFAEVADPYKEVARLPSDVTIWEDCSPKARSAYLLLPSYRIIAVAANGKQSLPAASPGIHIWRW